MLTCPPNATLPLPTLTADDEAKEVVVTAADVVVVPEEPADQSADVS